MQLNTLGLVHTVLRQTVRPGAVCIDATAGKGRDTALLCRLAGETGRVLAFDIQPEAVKQTKALLAQEGLQAEVAAAARRCHGHSPLLRRGERLYRAGCGACSSGKAGPAALHRSGGTLGQSPGRPAHAGVCLERGLKGIQNVKNPQSITLRILFLPASGFPKRRLPVPVRLR